MIVANMARSSAQARPGFLVNRGSKITLIPFPKPHLSYAQQLQLLKGRGLAVGDEARALWYLEAAGYYRLSGYLYPFREASEPIIVEGKPRRRPRSSTFIAGANFEKIASLYRFDNSLRLLALSAVEKLEIAIRSKIAHHLASSDPCAHLNPDFMHVKFKAPILGEDGEPSPSNYDIWIEQHTKLVSRSKEDFIKHFREKYEPPIPLWVSIEVWDFGLLSHFFSGLNDKDKAAIAEEFGLKRFVLLASWLRSMSHLRNICAHHSRLWNRALIDNPKPPGRGEIPILQHLAGDAHSRTHIYGVFAVMQYLLLRAGFGYAWAEELKKVIATFPEAPPAATLQVMGFPDQWAELELWNELPLAGDSVAAETRPVNVPNLVTLPRIVALIGLALKALMRAARSR